MIDVANRVPLAWHGGIDGDRIDLKMQGTVVFVDGARVYALANGIAQNNTRRRFQALAAAGKLAADEVDDWIGGFEFLQLLRLRAQMERREGAPGNPNVIEVGSLNDIDRRVLKEALRVARWQGAATIWFTDRTDRGGRGDPWEAMPGYWDEIVSRIGTGVSE